MQKLSSTICVITMLLMAIGITTSAQADNQIAGLGGWMDKAKKQAEDVIKKTVEESISATNPQPVEQRKEQPKMEEAISKPQGNSDQVSVGPGEIDKDIFTSPSEALPNESINQETSQVKKECIADHYYSTYHDCQCIAESFKAAQQQGTYKLLKTDPYGATINKKIQLRYKNWGTNGGLPLVKSIYNGCPNRDGIKESLFKSCAPYQKSISQNYQQYCECISENVANQYLAQPIPLTGNKSDRRNTESLRNKAGVACKSMYK